MTNVHQIPSYVLQDIWNAALAAAEKGTIYSIDDIDSLLFISTCFQQIRSKFRLRLVIKRMHPGQRLLGQLPF